MLDIGLIGNTEVLEPFVKRMAKNKNVNIIGKASVGKGDKMTGFHYTIPEFNRVELIERADVLLLDNSSLMPFQMLSDALKRGKHVFMAEYLDLTVEQCALLVKISNESRSVVQVSNPYFYTPAMQWMNRNAELPIFLDITDFTSIGHKSQKLYPVILMLQSLTGISPKKIGAVTFDSSPNKADFTNVRLEFGDASVVNFSYGSLESLEEFKIRAYSKNQFVTLNFTQKNFVCNNQPIDLLAVNAENEFDSFINAILQKGKKQSSIEEYLIAMHLVNKINKKTAQFFAQ